LTEGKLYQPLHTGGKRGGGKVAQGELVGGRVFAAIHAG